METPEYIHAERTALRLIARAEQCSAGLARKLEKRGHNEDCARKVISHLIELNLLNDSRYARFWLQSRLRFTRSPRQLLSSLCAKGVERAEAEAALKSILDEETETSLMERFVKKHKKKAGKSGDVTRSLKHVLKNEGFSYQVIQNFLETQNISESSGE